MIKNPEKARLIVLLVLVLFTAFLFLSLFNYNASKEAIREELITTALPLTRENIYSELLQDFTPSLNISSAMANDSFLIQWIEDGEQQEDEIIRYLDTIHRKYGYFSVFLVSENSGLYYHYDGVLKTISPTDSHDVWYYDFIESGKEYDLDVDTNEAADRALTIFINYRLENSRGELLGVTGVGIQMDNFSEFLRTTQDKYDRRIYLTDTQGRIQAHSDPQLIETANITEMPGISDAAGILLSSLGEPVNSSYHYRNRTYLATSRYLPELDWILIVEQDQTAQLTSARKNLIRTMLTGLLASVFIIAVTILAVNNYQKRLEFLSTSDALTGILNRRELEHQFERALYQFGRNKTPFSLMLIDIDNFKSINDTKGHLQGDKALKETADFLLNNIRPADILARWGGDEFVILTPTDISTALSTAERLRKKFLEEQDDPDSRISLSIGLAEYAEGHDLDDLIRRADNALYKSKTDGKNRVTSD